MRTIVAISAVAAALVTARSRIRDEPAERLV